MLGEGEGEGEEGVEAYLDAYRREAKREGATVTIQRWWRRVVQVGKFRRIIRHRLEAKETFLRPVFSAWVEWVVAVRADRIRLLSKAFRALEFEVVYARQRYKTADVFLAMQGDNPIFKLAGVSITSGSRAHKTIVAFRAMIQLRTTRLALQNWFQWAAWRKRRRRQIHALALRMDEMWSDNQARAALSIWSRLAHVAAAERAGAPTPVYPPGFVEWDAYAQRASRQRVLVERVLASASSVLLRTAFRQWHIVASEQARERSLVARADAFRTKILLKDVWPAWRSYTLAERAARWDLGRIFHKLKVEMKRRELGAAIERRHRLHMLHVVWKQWRGYVRFQKIMLMASVDRLRVVPGAKAKALRVAYLLQGPKTDALASMASMFGAWASLAKRSSLYRRFKVLHVLERRSALLASVFSALGAHDAAQDAHIVYGERTREALDSARLITAYDALLAGASPEGPQEEREIYARPLPDTGPGAAPARVVKLLIWRRKVTADVSLDSDPVFAAKVFLLAAGLGRRKDGEEKAAAASRAAAAVLDPDVLNPYTVRARQSIDWAVRYRRIRTAADIDTQERSMRQNMERERLLREQTHVRIERALRNDLVHAVSYEMAHQASIMEVESGPSVVSRRVSWAPSVDPSRNLDFPWGQGVGVGGVERWGEGGVEVKDGGVDGGVVDGGVVDGRVVDGEEGEEFVSFYFRDVGSDSDVGEGESGRDGEDGEDGLGGKDGKGGVDGVGKARQQRRKTGTGTGTGNGTGRIWDPMEDSSRGFQEVWEASLDAARDVGYQRVTPQITPGMVTDRDVLIRRSRRSMSGGSLGGSLRRDGSQLSFVEPTQVALPPPTGYLGLVSTAQREAYLRSLIRETRSRS